ncbi:MAG: patatin-like phospholipase family protein [Ramlibacter sp.]
MHTTPPHLPPHLPRRWVLGAGVSAVVSVAATGLTGCGGAHDGPDAPRSAPLAVPPGVAWVLSSGGPRGFAHVGVLKALHELGLQPALVVGSSVGALVGGLYAAGLPMRRIEQLALDVDVMDVVRPQVAGDAWLNASGLVRWFDDLAGQRRLEQLDTAFAAVALHEVTRQPVAFTHGRAGVAIQAACSIEGRFEPVTILGQRYLDADLALPLPARLARSLGARRVLAVDVSAHEDKAPPGTERWREADLRKRALTLPDARSADLVLHPDIGYYAGMRRAWREMALAQGYQHTMAQRAQLLALHAGAAP